MQLVGEDHIASKRAGTLLQLHGLPSAKLLHHRIKHSHSCYTPRTRKHRTTLLTAILPLALVRQRHTCIATSSYHTIPFTYTADLTISMR